VSGSFPRLVRSGAVTTGKLAEVVPEIEPFSNMGEIR
jgi:hypothetical protein